MNKILKSAVKAAVLATGVWAARKYGVDKKIKHKFEQIKYENIFGSQAEPAHAGFDIEDYEDNLDYTDISGDEQ